MDSGLVPNTFMYFLDFSIIFPNFSEFFWALKLEERQNIRLVSYFSLMIAWLPHGLLPIMVFFWLVSSLHNHFAQPQPILYLCLYLFTLVYVCLCLPYRYKHVHTIGVYKARFVWPNNNTLLNLLPPSSPLRKVLGLVIPSLTIDW